MCAILHRLCKHTQFIKAAQLDDDAKQCTAKYSYMTIDHGRQTEMNNLNSIEQYALRYFNTKNFTVHFQFLPVELDGRQSSRRFSPLDKAVKKKWKKLASSQINPSVNQLWIFKLPVALDGLRARFSRRSFRLDMAKMWPKNCWNFKIHSKGILAANLQFKI